MIIFKKKGTNITDKPSSVLLGLPSFSPRLPLIRLVFLSKGKQVHI